MTNLVDPSKIEEIVGRSRHPIYHFARFVSEEQTAYILHSQECVDSGIDLRECRFSFALDVMTERDDVIPWVGDMDEPVLVNLYRDGLSTSPYVVAGFRERLILRFGGISKHHVIRQRNFKVHHDDWCDWDGNEYDMWTRRAVENQALCGGQRATLVGIDVADWNMAERPIKPEEVTCARCRASYEKRLARGA